MKKRISVYSVFSVAYILLMLTGCGDNGSAGRGSAEQVAGSADALADIHDGKTLYELYCIACHDQGPGHPGTMRLQERVGEEQAALLDRDNLPPEYIKLVVREGFKLMPPFRHSEISERQLDELAAYITGEAD
jgi:mono/diheme cytochrome c family protein